MSKETKDFVTEATPITGATPIDGSTSDSGRWKSGLFRCFKYGCCHPALCCAWFAPTILMGQLLTRMKMTWSGDPSAAEEYKKTFRIVCAIIICNYLVNAIFYCSLTIAEKDDNDEVTMVPNDECQAWSHYLSTTVSSLFALYTLIVMIKLRTAIRAKYSIPEQNCEGCEDACCIFFCGFLSAVQMADQTANYEEDGAICFNATGLPPTQDSDGSLTQAIVV